ASGSSFTYFGTVEEAFAYAGTLGTSCTVTLRADCTVTESLAAGSGSEVTLDLAGYTLSAGDGSSISVLTVNGSLAVTDSSETGSGTVTGGTGTLIDDVSYGGGIYVPSGGSLTVTGGCVTGNTADYGGGIYAAGSVSLSGTPVITGNTSAGDAGGAEDNLYLPSGNTATLAGSLEEGAQVCVSAADVPSDGVTVPVTASESGTSYYLQSASYVISDAGYYVVADTDAKCLVLSVQEGREASVETADGTVSYYGTVEEAFAYVNTADTSCTVTLVSDCGITESLTLAWGHTAVLDLCGHTLAAEEGSSISVITVNGTMTLTDSSEDGTGTVTGGTGTVDDSYNPRGGGVYVAAWGSFTMAGGSITGNTLTATSFSSRVENEGSGFGAYGGGVCAMGDFTMTGGTISGNTVSGTYANDLCGGGVYAAGSVLMAGGSITGNKLIGSTIHYGGGLFAGGGFVMLAGSICDNVVTMAATSRSAYKGAGVYCTGGTAYINGGTISGNTASGNTQGTSTTSGLSLYNAGSYYPYVLGNKQSRSYVESDIETGCYGILDSLSHISLSGESAAVGKDFTIALAADDGYAFPGTLTLSYTAGGDLLTAGEDYAYDAGEGTLTIYAAAFIGPVTVSGAGIPETCSVSSSLEGAVLSGSASTAGGEDYSAVISALEGYSLPDAIVVEVDGTALTAGEDYSYDAESGALTIYAAAVTGDIVVSNVPAASAWEEPAQDEEGYYLLYDTEDILAFADMVENGYADSSARLMADVTVGADTGFAGIGAPYAPYTGTFDGDGHTVTVAISTDSAAGFFACVSGAVIEDLTVEGTVETTSGTYGAAGLVSYVSSGGVTIRNCMNGADVSGTAFVGGLVGRSGIAVTITMEDSSNEGDITNTGFYSGGIAARICNGSVTGCLNYGAVSALGYAGGIAGIAYSYGDLEIQNCGNEGMVTATGSGSSVSTDEGTLYSGYYAGGITGSARRELSTSLPMDSLYNAGDVSGYVYVGGITGSYCSDVGNAYNTGTVSQTNSSSSYSKSSGGLLGKYTTYDDAVVSNAYNAGEAPNPLIGTGGSSGYTGSGSTYSENCYFLETLGTDSYGIAVSSDELTALAGTLGDAYKENGVESYHGGYPVLSWEEPGEQYGVSFSLTNASVGSYWETTIAGAGWRAVLEADEYYALPDTITVTSGGTELTAGEDYAYDPSTGCIRVYGGSVTGAITVSAEAGLASYAVSISLEHVSNGGSAKAAIGEDYTTVLAADESYSLPEGVSVIVDGIMLAAGEDYTYDAETGELVIFASAITGDILVSAAVDTDMAVQDEDGYCLIGTQAELEYFAWMTGSVYAGFSARLTADIEVPADAGFTGIGTADAPYAGTFDGDGHTVTLEVSTDGAAGLFAYVSGATVMDVATAGT
ncbi:MAG: hypothetical protein LUG27_02325, partial [Clostridiales bacterium]|nr:hypothetical protein [Clostridiales bacterium]